MTNNARRESRYRWTASVSYKTMQDSITYRINELEELQQIIEEGPDFNEIAEITITYNFGDNDG